MDDAIKDIYTFPGHSQFTDPRDDIAETLYSSDGTYAWHYDKDGSFLFGESVPQNTNEGFSFWKLLYTAVNAVFSVLSRLGA